MNNNFEQEYLSLLDVFVPNMLFSDNTNNAQLHIPYLAREDDEFLGGLKHVNRGQVEYLFSYQEFMMQEIRNNYMPNKSLSDIIVDYIGDSDSDAESIVASVKHINSSFLSSHSWSNMYSKLPRKIESTRCTNLCITL